MLVANVMIEKSSCCGGGAGNSSLAVNAVNGTLGLTSALQEGRTERRKEGRCGGRMEVGGVYVYALFMFFLHSAMRRVNKEERENRK